MLSSFVAKNNKSVKMKKWQILRHKLYKMEIRLLNKEKYRK